MASMSSPFAFSHLPTLPLVRHPLASLLRFKVTREPIPQHNSNVLQIPRRLIVLRIPQRLPSVSSTCWCGPSPNMDSDSEASEKTYLLGISTSNWCAALGTLGFLETAYLTYIKLSNSDAFCAFGGRGCGDVLNSEYSYVFGVPLPLIGMISYGLVTFLALQQSRKDLVFGLGVDVRFLLLGTTTSMATASTYFMYLLSTKLLGASCSYCLISIFLSFSLFFITLKEYALEDIQKVVGLQLAIAVIVVAALGNSYTMVSPSMTSSSDITLEPYETQIIEQSTPWTIALAGHLHSIGAKMYGAFWCSHCVEQKQMFGREAAKLLDYIECFPDGVGKGRKMTMECALSGIEGFPTWIINGKVLSGEQNLQTLADASGFVFEDSYALASNQH